MNTLEDMGFLPSWIRRMKEIQNRIISIETKNGNLESGLNELEAKKKQNPKNAELQEEIDNLKNLSVTIIEELTEQEVEMENFIMEVAEVLLYPENPNEWADPEPLLIVTKDGVDGFTETNFYHNFMERLDDKSYPFFGDSDF